MRRYIFLLSIILLLTFCAISRFSDANPSASSRSFKPDRVITKQSLANATGDCNGENFSRTDIAVGRTPVSAVTGDINGDGALDLAIANRDSQSLTIVFGNGKGQFDDKNPVNISFPDLFGRKDVVPTSLTAGDYTDDGFTDLVVASQGSDQDAGVIILVRGTEASRITGPENFRQFVATPGTVAILSANLDNDNFIDLATIDNRSNLVGLFHNEGDGLFLRTFFRETGGIAPSSFVVGDFNLDGKNDLAVTNSFASERRPPSTVSLLLNNGDGTVGSGPLVEVPGSATAIAAGDFNKDGHHDLAVASDTNRVYLLHNDGKGQFKLQADSIEVGQRPSSIVAGDFNNDGAIDLAVANQSDHNISILLGDGNGSFSPSALLPVGDQPTSLQAVDVNKDGRHDLIVVNRAANSVTVLQNTCTNSVADFNLKFDPNLIKTKRGQKGKFILNIERIGGFSDKITITQPDTASLKIKLKPIDVSTDGYSIAYSYKVKNNAVKGDNPLIFTVKDSSGRARTGTLMMTVE